MGGGIGGWGYMIGKGERGEGGEEWRALEMFNNDRTAYQQEIGCSFDSNEIKTMDREFNAVMMSNAVMMYHAVMVYDAAVM